MGPWWAAKTELELQQWRSPLVQGSAPSLRVTPSLRFPAEGKDAFYLKQVGSGFREGDERRSRQERFWEMSGLESGDGLALGRQGIPEGSLG